MENLNNTRLFYVVTKKTFLIAMAIEKAAQFSNSPVKFKRTTRVFDSIPCKDQRRVRPADYVFQIYAIFSPRLNVDTLTRHSALLGKQYVTADRQLKIVDMAQGQS